MPDDPDAPSPETVLSWLKLLDSPALDLEPLEFYEERRRVQELRRTIPEFSLAAAEWPLHAERCWQSVDSATTALFRQPLTNNFMQWIAEYMSQIFRNPPAAAMIKLLEALHFGSVTPLHVAAALGLPSLCAQLHGALSDEERLRSGPYGNALFCALDGARVFLEGVSPTSWMHHLPSPQTDFPDYTSRVKTIQVFRKYKYANFVYYCEGRLVNLACLAFWNSLSTSEPDIFSSLLDMGAVLDKGFAAFLEMPLVVEEGASRMEVFAPLLVCALDHVINSEPDWSNQDSQEAKERLLVVIRLLLEETCGGLEAVNPGRVKSMFTHNIFGYKLQAAIDNGEEFIVERLSYDPRFDPNMTAYMRFYKPNDDEPNEPMPQRQDGGTILHLAVWVNAFKVVDLLIAKGGSLTAVDQKGRTPLMVSESPEMLSKLITVYGASTTHCDHTGRNIWHFAAATNDTAFLDVLMSIDPAKAENLLVKTDSGCTPLTEAFLFVETLGDQMKRIEPITPAAAWLLLAESPDEAYVSSTNKPPLPHCAAAWGAIALVDTLENHNIDFQVLDEKGRSPLHYVNFSASEELVRRLEKLCKGMPIADHDGFTAAETVLSNCKLIREEFDPGYIIEYASAHPSGTRRLQLAVYKRLLTPEVLAYRDPLGRNAWARFCMAIRDMVCTEDDRARFFRNSCCLAAAWLIDCGAIVDMEPDASGKTPKDYVKQTEQRQLIKLFRKMTTPGATTSKTALALVEHNLDGPP